MVKYISKKRKTTSDPNGNDDIYNFQSWKKRTKTQEKNDEEVLLNHFIRESIDGDGNCLFRSILYSLYQDDSEHIKLRREICEYMNKSQSRWEPLVTYTKEINTWKKYIKNMRKNGTWAELAQIQAAAEIKSFNFTIFHSKSISKITEQNNSRDFPMIYLEYYNYNHYNSLFPVKEYKVTIDIPKAKKKVEPRKIKTKKEQPETIEPFRVTRSKSVQINFKTQHDRNRKARQKSIENAVERRNVKLIPPSLKTRSRSVNKDSVPKSTKLSQNGGNSISLKVQNQVIVARLYESGYDAKRILNLNIKGLNRSTVYDQISTLNAHGEIGFRQGPGRQKKLDEDDVIAIVDYLTENLDASCPDISTYMSKLRGRNISAKVVRNALSELGYSFKEPRIAFLLSENHKKLRVEWAKANNHRDWKKVIFSDETTFWLGRSGVARWTPPDEENVHMVPKGVPKLNLWGAISWNGKVSLYIFRQNLTGKLYVDILSQKLPEMKQLYSSTSAWTLQQDNDPKHTSRVSKAWFVNNRVHPLPWPSYSPDLNPIENLWGYLKKAVAKKKPKTLDELEKYLLELWEQIDDSYIQKLVISMPNRCSEVMINNGNRICY